MADEQVRSAYMERIGKYEIIEELGRGGMGAVYRAHDPVIGREVAIKLILEGAFQNPQVRERFYREARSAGRLSHENITILYDVGEEAGRPYLVMEYLTGMDLRQKMREGKLSITEKINVALQVAQGLNYAHKNGVVHRDVKPDNIQVLENGRVKIMDFGIARLGTDNATLTQTNTSIGTPRYMSPEQVRGAKVDGRSDIFAFGVVLYELLTGVNPFEGDHITAVIYKILHAEPDPIRLEYGRLSETLQQIVSKCLAKEPDDRYQSFDQVIHDLNALTVRHDATLSRSAVVSDNTTVFVPRQKGQRALSPALMAVAGLLLVGALGAGLYAAFGTGGAEEQPLTPGLTTASPDVSEVAPEPSDPVDDSATVAASDPEEDVLPAANTRESTAAATPEPPQPRTDPARPAAEARRREMVQARSRVEERRTESAVASLWQRAMEHERNGTRQLDANAASAARSFESATALYEQMAEVLAEADRTAAARENVRPADPPQPTSSGNVADADRARTEMESAKRGVAAPNTESAPYQEGLRLEQQGRQAYQNRTYDIAARHFGQAQRSFAEAAALPTPEERAARGVAGLTRRLKQGFENEDLDLLGGISSFYSDWDRFFSVAEEISAEVVPGPVRVDGDRYLVDVRIRLDYLDNKQRRQSNSFTHAWSVAPRGDDWVVTAVLMR